MGGLLLDKNDRIGAVCRCAFGDESEVDSGGMEELEREVKWTEEDGPTMESMCLYSRVTHSGRARVAASSSSICSAAQVSSLC